MVDQVDVTDLLVRLGRTSDVDEDQVKKRHRDAAEAAWTQMYTLYTTSEGKVAIAEAGGVPALIGLLRCVNTTCKEGAVRALSALALNARNKAQIIAEGGIPPLVEMLSSSSTPAAGMAAGHHEAAAGALRMIALNSSEAQIAIAAAGGIPPLIQLTRSGTPAAQEIAAWTLWNLAGSGDNALIIVTRGGIPPLVELLKNGFSEAKATAAGALGCLAAKTCSSHADDSPPTDARMAIAMAGGIPPLIAMVRSGSQSNKATAAQALASLSTDYDNKIVIAASGGIPPLVELSRSGSSQGKEAATLALARITTGAENNQVAVATAAGVVPLLDIMRGSSETDGNVISGVAREKAAVALANIARNPANKRAISQAGGIPPLIEMLPVDERGAVAAGL